MPSDLYGFSGNECVTYAMNWIGNQSSEFRSLAEQTLPLAEFRWCKAHDWGFLRKQNLSLTVASGTDEYTLSVANLGFYMSSTDVESIFSVSNNRYLQKKTLNELRQIDPNQNDGNTTSPLLAWATVGDNRIVVYPKTFNDTTLKIDGKIRPGALSTLSNYPTIPYHYQDSFLTYFIALLLQRENDDRAQALKQEAMILIRQDIADDMRNTAPSDGDRIKHPNELPKGQPEFDALNQLWDPY